LARPEFTSEHKDLIEKVRDELSGSIGKVLYLGPLRQDPQRLFEDKPVEDASELGTKGEGTVALLFYNKDRVVNYVAPETVYEETQRSISGSVLEALNVWVSYLGIADCVDVARAPPYGLTLKIRSPGVGEVASDLTNVGVGASQALPILLLGICAPLGATIIYEQPELHLHPALQCKLTDFFVAQLKMGKQVILETHSEHIVNTVRLHIAKGSLTAEGLSLIFCERDQNGSTATVIDVDRRGLLPRWPSGFFDKSEQTLAEILRKALE
jgi:predicted ATPase